jgi:spermidine synthase
VVLTAIYSKEPLRKNILPFLLGFIALSYQIFLLREFSVHFYGNEITFGFLLASWLLWGGLGSIVAKGIGFSISRFKGAYVFVIIVFPLCLVILRFSRIFIGILPSEMTGMIPIFLFSMGLSLPICFPLGLLFVFNTHFNLGNLSRVYLLESLGASVAGLIVYFLFIPLLSNWQATAAVGALASIVLRMSIPQKKRNLTLVFTLCFFVLFFASDFPSQKIYWQPFSLIKSKDTPYGKLQVLKTEEQISLYNNSLLIYSYPDLASSEESVHFSLLQNSGANTILLIGGGAGGSLSQVLKYPRLEVDYVEIDPEVIRMSLEFLPEREIESYHSRRIHIFYEDGRAFLKNTKKVYDIIILNLPDPSTAQINRFYTREFFLLAREKLSEKGIFSFRVSSSENYISYELQNFLASLYHTLKGVFAEVKIVPGDTNIFLASDRNLSLDVEELSRKIERLNLNNSFVSPQFLPSRLSPLRVDLLERRVQEGKKTDNLDLAPISYFYNTVLWSTQFQGIETTLLSFLLKINRLWLLDVPLLFFILMVSFFLLRAKKSAFFLLPVAVLGFTTITVEIIALIFFQTLFGYLYKMVALLFTSFMAGLFAGSLFGSARKNVRYVQILFLQSGFVLFLLLILALLNAPPPQWSFFLGLLVLGFLGGDLFVVSNRLYLEEKQNYGLGYGLDLLGSFLGAVAVSSLLIPLFGFLIVLRYILLLNSFCFVFLVFGWKRI